MGRPVEFTDVAAAIEAFGPLATLVTVTADGTPHVGTVLVAIADDSLAIEVGPRTRENLLAQSAVSLVWMQPERDYQLILDGLATLDGSAGEGLSAVTIRVDHGILHRLASRPDAGPTCLALSQAARA